MKKLLICLLAILTVLGTGSACAELSGEYPITFGDVPWLSSPETLEQWLANDEYQWTGLVDNGAGGEMVFGGILALNGNRLSYYNYYDAIKQGWDIILWEGCAKPLDNVILFAGAKIYAVYPIYVVKDDEKQLISITVVLSSKVSYNFVLDHVKAVYGEPMISADAYALWSDPDSETDSTMLYVRGQDDMVKVILAEADVLELLNSQK